MKANMMTKKRFSYIAVVLMMALFTLFSPLYLKNAHAASTASKNKVAHKLYSAKKKSIRARKGAFGYKYYDITGDGVDEMLVQFSMDRVYMGFAVYTTKGNKLTKMVEQYAGPYGYNDITCYRKTGTIICGGYGHGNQWYHVYKMKNGKLVRVATKACSMGGNYKWVYTNGKEKTITKSKYDSILKSVKKGKKRIIKQNTWGTYR